MIIDTPFPPPAQMLVRLTETAPKPLPHRIATQAEAALKSGSTWVVLAVVSIAGLWLGLDETQQGAVLNALPFLKGYGVVLTPFAVWAVARLKPSAAMTAESKALLNELARLQLNEWLRTQGKPEIAPGHMPAASTRVEVLPVPAPPPLAAPPVPGVVLPEGMRWTPGEADDGTLLETANYLLSRMSPRTRADLVEGLLAERGPAEARAGDSGAGPAKVNPAF